MIFGVILMILLVGIVFYGVFSRDDNNVFLSMVAVIGIICALTIGEVSLHEQRSAVMEILIKAGKAKYVINPVNGHNNIISCDDELIPLVEWLKPSILD